MNWMVTFYLHYVQDPLLNNDGKLVFSFALQRQYIWIASALQ